MIDKLEFDLDGLIDMHIHTAPDTRHRYCDDIQAAKEAQEAGMRAILIKSHITLTADRACVAEAAVGNIRVFGGLVLNKPVGGLNPSAVEAALKMGAKEIWMPTKDAANHLRLEGKGGGICIIGEDNGITPEVREIVNIIRQSEAILATGHISVEESIALVAFAKGQGLQKIIVTHPESPLVRMPAQTQIDLSGEGVFFERCYVDTTHAMEHAVTIYEIADSIRRVGIDSTVLTTDFGLASLPPPVQGFREYLQKLSNEGFNPVEIRVMAGDNPYSVLDY